MSGKAPKKPVPGRASAAGSSSANIAEQPTAPVVPVTPPICTPTELLRIAFALYPDAFQSGVPFGSNEHALWLTKGMLEKSRDVLADPRTCRQWAVENYDFNQRMKEWASGDLQRRYAESNAKMEWFNLMRQEDLITMEEASGKAGYKTVREFRKALKRTGYPLADTIEVDFFSIAQLQHFRKMNAKRTAAISAVRQRARRKKAGSKNEKNAA